MCHRRATGKAFVRISGCIQHKPVQARGGAVSEATATTESVVVEALRMSNLLCDAMGGASGRAGSKKKGGSIKALSLSKPPIRGRKKEEQNAFVPK